MCVKSAEALLIEREKMINIELKLAQTVNEGLLDDVNVVSEG